MGLKVKSLQPGQGGGFGELYLKLKQFPEKAKVAVAFGMYEAMQDVMLDAKRRAPKDTRAMEYSGYVSKPKVTQHTASVESGFGGKSERYVLRVHNDPNHAVTGEPFFFQNAVDAGEKLIKQVITTWVRYFIRHKRLKPLPQKQVPESPWEKAP
jgi:hypothetical protein